jgi:hypothetical protein
MMARKHEPEQAMGALLPPSQAALALGVAEGTLAGWRQRGFGPKFVRLSCRSVRYDPVELRRWLAARVEGGPPR